MTHLIDCNKAGFENMKNGVITTIIFKPERGIVSHGDNFVLQEMGETKGLFTGNEVTLVVKEVVSHYHSAGLKNGYYAVTLGGHQHTN